MRKLIRKDSALEYSMKLGMNNRTVRELLSFGLMAGLFFVIFYVSIGFVFKIFMAVFVFVMIFLLGFADEALKQIENRKF